MVTHDIKTSYRRKPVRTDAYDWMASYASDEPDEDGMMLVGFGATSQDAVDDLIDRAAEEIPFPFSTPDRTS